MFWYDTNLSVSALSILSRGKIFRELMIFDSKLVSFCLFELSWASNCWELNEKFITKSTDRKRTDKKNKNQIKKFTVVSKSSSINYGWSKICSFAWNCKFIWCDNIIHQRCYTHTLVNRQRFSTPVEIKNKLSNFTGL